MGITLPLNNVSTPDDGLGTEIRSAHVQLNANMVTTETAINNMLTLLERTAGESNLGVMPGTIINDNVGIRTALTQLEAALENNNALDAAYVPNPGDITPAPNDTLEEAIAKLHRRHQLDDTSIRLVQGLDGLWNPTSGTFPTSGTAEDGTVRAGDEFVATSNGTIDGVDVEANNRLRALTDNASSSTFSGNWMLLDDTIDFGTGLHKRPRSKVGKAGNNNTGAAPYDHEHGVQEILSGSMDTVINTGANPHINKRHLLRVGSDTDFIADVPTAPVATDFNGDPISAFQNGDRYIVKNMDGFNYTLKPHAGGTLNDVVDGTYVLTEKGQSVEMEWDSGAWTITPQNTPIVDEDVLIDVDGADNTFYPFSTGDTWAQVKAKYKYLRITGNQKTDGADNVRPWSFIYDDETHGLTEGLTGSNLIMSSAKSAVNIWFERPADTDLGLTYREISGDTPTSGRMQFKVVGVRRQAYVPPGTLIAETGVVELVNGGSTTRTNSFSYNMGFTPEQLAEKFDLIVMSARDGGWDNKVVGITVPTASLLDGTGGEVRISDLTSGTARYIMWADFGAGSTTMQVEQDTSSGNRTFSHFRMFGIRKQYNAIKAGDAKLSTDAVDIANYTGSPDDATTQGIYERDNGSMPGAPVANFVWTLDVDVIGEHIKQTFNPRDTGTTVLGHWVRRSFNGGTTWTAWAGR